MTSDPTPAQDGITPAEYQRRRAQVLKGLDGAAGLVLAGDAPPPPIGRWRPDANFLYLTGIDSEPGAAVLFDPTAENPRRRCVLFLRPLSPERERWDGYREPIGAALRSRTGFVSVQRSDTLAGTLTATARRSRRLACLHPFSVYPGSVGPDLSAFRQVAERVLGVGIEDRTQLLPSLRAVKSVAERHLIRQAVAATAAGYEAALAVIRPGATEEQVATALEFAFRSRGARSVAFNSIVGSGLASTVLHYTDNSAILQDGDLMVIDAGAEFGGYAADVTRTVPVNGRFTPDQREVYEVVLAAQAAAIRAARPGARFWEVDDAARAVIDQAGYADAFIHGVGHPLGLLVHDVAPDGPLKAGMVITIEPGVYLPERRLGVRIEDDIVVGRAAPQVITAAIPKTVRDIEAAMRR